MSDELNPETRRLVELARRARTPGEDAKLRIAERLAVPLAAGLAATTATATAKATSAAAAAKAGSFSLGAKVAALVALGAVGAAVVVSQAVSPPNPQPVPAQVAAPSTPVAPSASAPARPPEPLALEPPAPAAPRKPNQPPSTTSSGPGAALAAEAALLHQAQAAWRAGQSSQALALANQHAQRFPRSQLANERDVLRVLSMCKLGQARNAKQVAARLLKNAKGSPWYQSVAESCAGG